MILYFYYKHMAYQSRFYTVRSRFIKGVWLFIINRAELRICEVYPKEHQYLKASFSLVTDKKPAKLLYF